MPGEGVHDRLYVLTGIAPWAPPLTCSLWPLLHWQALAALTFHSGLWRRGTPHSLLAGSATNCWAILKKDGECLLLSFVSSPVTSHLLWWLTTMSAFIFTEALRQSVERRCSRHAPFFYLHLHFLSLLTVGETWLPPTQSGVHPFVSTPTHPCPDTSFLPSEEHAVLLLFNTAPPPALLETLLLAARGPFWHGQLILLHAVIMPLPLPAGDLPWLR